MPNIVLTHRPSPGNINTPFGRRPKPTPSSPSIHYGQDYGWGNGKTIYAAAAGRVKSAGLAGAYGIRTVVEIAPGVEFWVCHQSATWVKAGDELSGGQPIGLQGATGNVVGVHLHFELRINGVAVDPAPYFRLANAVPSKPTPAPDVPAPIDENEDDMRQILRESTGKSYFIAPQYIKSVADAKTREIGEYVLDEPTRGLSEDDFERTLNAYGVPVDVFLDLADEPLQGWSQASGFFSEVPFGALAASWG